MSRFVIIFLACMAIVPLAAYLLENRLEVLVSSDPVAEDQDVDEAGERSHPGRSP